MLLTDIIKIQSQSYEVRPRKITSPPDSANAGQELKRREKIKRVDEI